MGMPDPFSMVGAGLNAGANTASAIMTNNANLKIAQMNNETSIRNTDATNAANLQLAENQAQWSKEQQQAQNDFNYKMWQENNEYNSPEAQMNRYIQAGLNPNMAINNGSNGNSAAPVQQTTLPSYERAQMQRPEQYLAHLMAPQFNLDFADTKLKSEQARKLRIENDNAEGANDYARTQKYQTYTAYDTSGKKLSKDEVHKALNGDSSVDLGDIALVSHRFKNMGEYRAYLEFSDGARKMSDNDFAQLKNSFDTKITNLKLNNPEIAEAVANMPLKEFEQLTKSILNVQADTSNKKKEGKLLEQEYNFNEWYKENEKNSTLRGLYQRFADGEIGRMEFGFNVFILLLDNIIKNVQGPSFGRRK